MTIKGPYQIVSAYDVVQHQPHWPYRFELRHMPDNRLVDVVNSKSPIPPRKMLDRQARLNTSALIDRALLGA